ncbi:MAG: polymer-forming cytoskeletal protein [Elusimicrobiota bacterium]|jgi:cytoskeletal protein CcmA (bactofilin family)
MSESSDVVTVVGPEAYFHGVLTVRGSLRVEGEVEGDVTEAQSVIIGKRGKVRGDVAAQSVIVAGTLVGDVTASGQIELKAGGRISGNIRTQKLVIEEGSVFDGNCTMAEADKASAEPARHHGAAKQQAAAS